MFCVSVIFIYSVVSGPNPLLNKGRMPFSYQLPLQNEAATSLDDDFLDNSGKKKKSSRLET